MFFYFNFDFILNCNVYFILVDLSIYLNTFCIKTSFFSDELFFVASFFYLVYIIYINLLVSALIGVSIPSFCYIDLFYIFFSNMDVYLPNFYNDKFQDLIYFLHLIIVNFYFNDFASVDSSFFSPDLLLSLVLELCLYFFDLSMGFKFLNIICYKLFVVDFMGLGIIFIIISFILLFICCIYDLMYIDLIVCYIFLECVLLLFVLLNCVFFYIFWDIRFLVFSIFLISIAACEIAIGLSLLVRYK